MERCNARTMEIFRRLGHRRTRARRRAAARRADGRLPGALDGRARTARALAVSVGRGSQSRDRGAQRRPAARTLSADLAVHARAAAAHDRRRAAERHRPLQHASWSRSCKTQRRQCTRTCAPTHGTEKRCARRISSAATAARARCAKQLGIALAGEGRHPPAAPGAVLRPRALRAHPDGQRAPLPHRQAAALPVHDLAGQHEALDAARRRRERRRRCSSSSTRRSAIPLDVQMLSVNEWTQQSALRRPLRDGRVFIAGDAAHLVIPTGGLGMNTGVGDAIDLSWKLAATLQGWGGPELLASYEAERRPIGLRNVRASGEAARGRFEGWRKSPTRSTRWRRRFDVEQRKVTEILGIEAGYRYVELAVDLRRTRWARSGQQRLRPHDLARVPSAARLARRRQRPARSARLRLHAAAVRSATRRRRCARARAARDRRARRRASTFPTASPASSTATT